MCWRAYRRGKVDSSATFAILAARARHPEVEWAVLDHGWDSLDPDDYDVSSYRNWTHKLSPMRHRDLTLLSLLPDSSANRAKTWTHRS